MNILVTGGTGFIGSHTILALIEAGYNPVIVDNFKNSDPSVLDSLQDIAEQKIKFYQENCQNTLSMKLILKESRIDGIIHFAGDKDVGNSMEKPLHYYNNNLNPLISVLKAADTEGVKNLVFSSSATIYGLPDKLPIDETTRTQTALSPYGNSKQMGEQIIKDMVQTHSGLKALSLRYFNPIGAHASGFIGELPYNMSNNLVASMTQTAAGLRNVLTIFGDDYPTPDGTCIRDYIHVMDLAEAHVAALNFLKNRKTRSFYDVVNVGSGKGNSVKEVINTFESISNIKIPYKIGDCRIGDAPELWTNVSKAKALLNWSAHRNLAEALRDTWHWQRNWLSGASKSKAKEGF